MIDWWYWLDNSANERVPDVIYSLQFYFFLNKMINALIDYSWWPWYKKWLVKMSVSALKNLISRIKYPAPFFSVQTS